MSSIDSINQYLNPDKTILIPVLNTGSHANFGLALALQKMLQAKGAKVNVVVEDKSQYEYLDFLNQTEVEVGFPAGRESVVSLDISKNQIESLKYEVEGDKLNIYLTTERGHISLDDLEVSDMGVAPDLIMTVGVPKLRNLGSLYTSNPEVFFKTPIVNLDNTFENKAFGKINIIEIGMNLMSQLVYEFANTLGLDISVGATELMFALMEETNNFQGSNTPPVAYQLASELVEKGAKRDQIIETLYRSKPLNMLKLMGRTMAHANYFPLSGALDGKEIFYTKLYPHDFEKTDTTEEDIAAMTRELSEHIPLSAVGINIMIETGNSIKTGYAVFRDSVIVDKVMHILGGSLVRGVIKYSFPTEKDVHAAVEEANVLIAESLFE
jgi:hypothetical protein